MGTRFGTGRELHCRPTAKLVALWKPTIESLDALLGQTVPGQAWPPGTGGSWSWDWHQ